MKIFCAVFLIGMAVFSTSETVCAEKVVVVLSRSLQPYEQAWQGFQQTPGFQIEKRNMEGNAENGQTIMNSITPDTQALILIGSEATLAAKKTAAEIPMVYTMVLEDPRFQAQLTGGVLMRVNLDKQLNNIARLFPARKKIGVIYNVQHSQNVIQEAREIVSALGRQLVPIAVENTREIPMALDKIKGGNVDLLWSVVDPVVAKPESMQMLIQQTVRERVPFVALSRYHVKAGALAALSVDYQDMGQQTAVLTKRMLESGKTQPAEFPRKLILFVNTKTKNYMGLDKLPELPGVDIVYE